MPRVTWWSGRVTCTCLSDSIFIPDPCRDRRPAHETEIVGDILVHPDTDKNIYCVPEVELLRASMGARRLVAPRPAKRLFRRLGLLAHRYYHMFYDTL